MKKLTLLLSLVLITTMIGFVSATIDEDINGLTFKSTNVQDSCSLMNDFDASFAQNCEQEFADYDNGEYAVYILKVKSSFSKSNYFSFLNSLSLEKNDFLCSSDKCVLYLKNNDVFFTTWLSGNNVVIISTPVTTDTDFDSQKWENLLGAYSELYLTILDEADAESFEEEDIQTIEPIEEPINLPDEVIEEDKELICIGCVKEDKCFPIGYRTNEEYCSGEDEIFNMQKEPQNSCNNNFECDSNLCINDECVSGSLWAKFVRWFSKLFG